MDSTDVLQLDATGEYLGGPEVGPHDNSAPVSDWMETCVEVLDAVGGN